MATARPPVSDEGGDRRPSRPPWRRRAERPRLCGRGADLRRAREPGRPNEARSLRERARVSKNRRAKAVSAQRLSADGPEHQTEAAERSVRVFMRSRSRPQRPRPAVERSEVCRDRSKESTKCRRGGPFAAQRSSGLPRRQGGSPFGADGRGKPGGRKGGAQPGPDGRWRPRGHLSPTKEVTGGQAGHHGAGERSVRVFAVAEPTAQKPTNRGVRTKRGRSGSGAGSQKTGGPRQSARSACLPTAQAPNRSGRAGDRVFMRSRSRPQRPRTGSRTQ